MRFKILLTVSFTAIVIVMLSFWFHSRRVELMERNVSILFERDGQSFFTLIEFVEPNIMRVSNFNAVVWSNEIHDENVFETAYILSGFMDSPLRVLHWFPYTYSRLIEKEVLELSQEQLNALNRLVRNVSRRNANREYKRFSSLLGHITHVWANIDDDIYWSLYLRNSTLHRLPRAIRWEVRRDMNRNLMALAIELVELSPLMGRIAYL